MKPVIKAAGVLPYSKDSEGNTWFLLGREKPNQNWGIDSGSWSEFGGSILSSETPEEGAAREFFEETMGCMWHKAWMENELKNGRYLLAMDSKTPSGKGYRSFVKYVPFLDYPGRFARYKMLAKKQPEMFQRMVPNCFTPSVGGERVLQTPTMLQTCVEKTSMGWFSVDQMRRAVEKYKNARKNQVFSHSHAYNNSGNQRSYCEPDMIPHIRRGFAMDFDHLLTTTWAQNNFQDDHLHFPLVFKTPKSNVAGTKSAGAVGATAVEAAGDDFEIIETSSGTLRPLVKTPRFTAEDQGSKLTHGKNGRDRPKTPYTRRNNNGAGGDESNHKKPPVIKVSTAGYSFKKKRKRKRNRPAPSADEYPGRPTETCIVSKTSKHDYDHVNNGAPKVVAKKQKHVGPAGTQRGPGVQGAWTTVVNKKKKKKHSSNRNEDDNVVTRHEKTTTSGRDEGDFYKPIRPIF